MSSEVNNWFSATELSLLGEQLIAQLPKTMQGCKWRAKKEGWKAREVKGSGGPGGILTEYQPPAAVLVLIHSFLGTNPDFFAKSKTRTKTDLARVSKEVFGDAPQRLRQQAVDYSHEVEALVNPQPEGRLLMLQMVLRMSESKLKEPPTPDVAKKIVDLVDAWMPFGAQYPDMKERLEALRATAVLFV
jgi:hypothetical protein